MHKVLHFAIFCLTFYYWDIIRQKHIKNLIERKLGKIGYLIISYTGPELKFIYSEKATKFCEIFTLLLSYVVPVKSKMKISQNFVAFSEFMNFDIWFVKHIWLKTKIQFFIENLKRKRKKQNNLTLQSGDLDPRFSVISCPVLIFLWSEEPEIKSKQAS